MKDESGRIWKEVFMPKSKYCRETSIERQRISVENYKEHGRRSLGWHSNQEPTDAIETVQCNWIDSEKTSFLLFFQDRCRMSGFLIAYSKAKFKSSDDKASPCFRPFWIVELSE
jgi:hypothetical protein